MRVTNQTRRAHGIGAYDAAETGTTSVLVSRSAPVSTKLLFSWLSGTFFFGPPSPSPVSRCTAWSLLRSPFALTCQPLHHVVPPALERFDHRCHDRAPLGPHLERSHGGLLQSRAQASSQTQGQRRENTTTCLTHTEHVRTTSFRGTQHSRDGWAQLPVGRGAATSLGAIGLAPKPLSLSLDISLH